MGMDAHLDGHPINLPKNINPKNPGRRKSVLHLYEMKQNAPSINASSFQNWWLFFGNRGQTERKSCALFKLAVACFYLWEDYLYTLFFVLGNLPQTWMEQSCPLSKEPEVIAFVLLSGYMPFSGSEAVWSLETAENCPGSCQGKLDCVKFLLCEVVSMHADPIILNNPHLVSFQREELRERSTPFCSKVQTKNISSGCAVTVSRGASSALKGKCNCLLWTYVIFGIGKTWLENCLRLAKLSYHNRIEQQKQKNKEINRLTSP